MHLRSLITYFQVQVFTEVYRPYELMVVVAVSFHACTIFRSTTKLFMYPLTLAFVHDETHWNSVMSAKIKVA